MKVIRKQEIEVDKVYLGDQINIFVEGGIGKSFTATAHKIEDGRILFIFDDCVAEKSRNDDFNSWFNVDLFNALPNAIKDHIDGLILPTYGMVFGHDEFYSYYEPDYDKQLLLMRSRNYRISYNMNGYNRSYWLQNRGKESSCFAYVGYDGFVGSDYASNSLGVRPAFYWNKDLEVKFTV